jgi:hypothetical protein
VNGQGALEFGWMDCTNAFGPKKKVHPMKKMRRGAFFTDPNLKDLLGLWPFKH